MRETVRGVRFRTQAAGGTGICHDAHARIEALAVPQSAKRRRKPKKKHAHRSVGNWLDHHERWVIVLLDVYALFLLASPIIGVMYGVRDRLVVIRVSWSLPADAAGHMPLGRNNVDGHMERGAITRISCCRRILRHRSHTSCRKDERAAWSRTLACSREIVRSFALSS